MFAANQKNQPKKPKPIESYVTCQLIGSRLGDQLINYMHAKWISYKYGVPFLYRPFPYSELLELHNKELPFKRGIRRNVSQVVKLNDLISTKIAKDTSTLYIVPFFTESLGELAMGDINTFWPVDWENEEFRTILKNLIKPIDKLPELNLPKDKITVAVHVRLGGGADPPDAYLVWPLKFPSHEFYIAQIKRLNDFFSRQPLYVYLFTDDPDPPALVKMYQEQINAHNIEFACRKNPNSHDTNVLEDLFAMTKFDCLIRADSHFAIVAEKIADYKVVISPLHHVINHNKSMIDKVIFKLRETFPISNE